VSARLERIYRALLTEIEFLQVEKKLKTRVKRERETNQREYWLNEQMKAIQKELGDKEGRSDLEELAQALAAKNLPVEVQSRAEKELRKLSQMNMMSAEATVVRNYLDWIVALPWTEESDGAVDLQQAARVLDADHFGLRRIKERILEYLAVSTLVDKMRGPILCLVGPPGVGKTSLARSIANATGRPFVKISLGGVRDEAEIRGHRRTYIGAMPGKILHAMKRAEKVDPVVLLDEVDKMSADFRGDPSAALLEVLDPEQNTQFQDHYLDIDYDLSKITFICTANSLQGIPLPLQDRLEIIELSGYTEQEKVAIARRYLLPRQLELNGIAPPANADAPPAPAGQPAEPQDSPHLEISNKALLDIIRGWTKESGVRDLERQLARRLPQGGAPGGPLRHRHPRQGGHRPTSRSSSGPRRFLVEPARDGRPDRPGEGPRGVAVGRRAAEHRGRRAARARATCSSRGAWATGCRSPAAPASPTSARGPWRSGWTPTSTSTRTCTCTTRATRSRPTARRRASRWRRRW
jgi:ATP-dependent Lon protease